MNSDTSKHTALASITATYTDSENEPDSDTEIERRLNEAAISQESTPSSSDDRYVNKEKNQLSKLVSYTAEGYEDDEKAHSEDSQDSYFFMQDDSIESKNVVTGVQAYSPVTFHRRLLSLKKHEIQLPVEPPGRCSKSLQEKIAELYSKKKEGKDMNASIQKRKDFRNPSIYEKLITYCNIDERGTNYPPETYDPHSWGPESFYEELAKRQKEEMDRREKEKKERTKVEFMSGTAKKPSTDAGGGENGKRKSKWDVGVSQTSAVPSLKPATLVTPSVLPVATGTKPTVISAFGTITKKVKQ